MTGDAPGQGKELFGELIRPQDSRDQTELQRFAGGQHAAAEQQLAGDRVAQQMGQRERSPSLWYLTQFHVGRIKSRLVACVNHIEKW